MRHYAPISNRVWYLSCQGAQRGSVTRPERHRSSQITGLDLDAAATLPDMTADEMLEGQEHWARAVSGFRTTNTPVIAAVNGSAPN